MFIGDVCRWRWDGRWDPTIDTLVFDGFFEGEVGSGQIRRLHRWVISISSDGVATGIF